jgi:hypothetical protein
LSNAPEPKKTDAAKKPKNPETEVTEKTGPGKKAVPVPGKAGPRQNKKLNGVDDGSRSAASAKHQVCFFGVSTCSVTRLGEILPFGNYILGIFNFLQK